MCLTVSAGRIRGTYLITLADVSGVVAANNFLSVLNPVGSGVVQVAQQLDVSSYSVGATGGNASMIVKRITAASGGTLQTAANLSRFITTNPDPKAQVRVSNPTVTLRTGNPIAAFPPPQSTGAGAGTVTIATPPANDIYVLYPGEGLVVGTASGDVDQVWTITYVWKEVGA